VTAPADWLDPKTAQVFKIFRYCGQGHFLAVSGSAAQHFKMKSSFV
jgi:hypothetical protein